MTTFVAVHGAFFGGWVWKPVAALLEARGHRFFRPTLTGCGERDHLGGPAVDLKTHVRDIVALLEMEELEDVILVGHSYAGMVVAGVAQQAHARLRGLVHLDALLPEHGESTLDHASGEMFDHARALAVERGDGWRIPCFLPLDSLCPEGHDLRPWMAAQLRGMTLNAVAQKLDLPRDLSHLPMLFVYCKAEALGLFEKSRDRAARRPNTELVELDTQHALMLTRPQEVADLLLSFSERAAGIRGRA
ncbi:MAG: alpha/beta hydrolase [Alphaproteobacteria bacterium]|nr:alpha/beta hydrolase [Alphaproteobacteria bacterium]